MLKQKNHLIVACVLLVVLAQGSSSYAFNPDADESLMGLWKLNEGTGRTAVDSSGHGRNGTFNGDPAWVTGWYGGGLELDGDDYVDTGYTENLATWTIAIWVASPAAPSTSGSPSGPLHRENNYQFNWNHSSGGWPATVAANIGGWTNASLGTLEANTWYHLCGTFDGTALKAYTNGVLISTTGASGTPSSDSNTMKLGRHAANAQYFTGTIDDARVYNRALTLEEIQLVMAGGIDPGLAATPSPQNEATDVPRETILSWEPGESAAAHDVYLGTSFADVNSADRTNPLGVLVSQGQDTNSYDPPTRLELGKTYYWRIDEVNAAPDSTIFKGEIWSFTVEPYSYAITGIKATASSIHNATTGPEKTIDGSGLDPNTDQHSTTTADMWLSNRKGAQPTWIQYEFPGARKLDKMLIWNSNQTTESTVGFGAKEVTVEYSLDGAAWTALGDFEFAQAPGEDTYAANTTVDFAGVAARFVKLTTNSNWGEILPQYGLSEVRFLYVPVAAREPSPAAGATSVHPQVPLSWRAGREAASHEVYLGTDPNALALTATVAAPGYDVATDLLKSYYWKVVEVNNAEANARWESDLWNFTTAEFIAVDDFESYTNDSPKRVFQTWIDGAGFSEDESFPTGNPGNGSGALVGYDPAAGDVMEKALIHGGGQSMPLYYDNSTGTRTSEAERTFADPQDWTQHTISTLVIWFRGDANNVAAPLYAKINGTKVVYNNGAAGTAFGVWKQWNIPLSSVSGVNLKSVKTLAIGVGDGSAGGAGTIFIDDIRLYAAAPQAVTPANPGTSGLVLLYAMEGNVQDTSGKNNHGAASGEPLYIQGLTSMGKALQFDGLNDYVELPIGTLLSTSSSMTVATFANMAESTSGWQRIFDFGTGSTNYMFLTPRQGTSGTMRFAIRTTAVTEQTATAPATLPFGWHHVAVVIDSAAMQLRLYMDGTLVASGATTLLPKDLGVTTQNWLGRSQFTADGFYNGSLDDFRIYNRALSEAEVRYLAGDR